MSTPRGWEEKDNRLTAEFKFDSFKEAIAFVNAVAGVAEGQQHHPDIHNSYNKVTISTWSHDANAITDRDYKLAEAINNL